MQSLFKNKYLKVTLLVGLSLLISAFMAVVKIAKEIKPISIEKLITSNNIRATIKGKGGYQQNCIEMNLVNLSRDTQRVWLEAGRRLIAEDSAFQDIFIVKESVFVMLPLEKKTIDGYGFCCQSHDRAPAKNAKFSIGYMAPPQWVTLANLINENDFPVAAIQNAIWVVSNDHPISSIESKNMDDIQSLREVVAKIKGIQIPWYTLSFEKDTSMLFSNRPERIRGKLAYNVMNNTVISIHVRDKKGTIVATLINGVSTGSGSYTYNLDLKVSGWKKGEYDIFIYEDFSNLNMKKSFKL